LEKIFLARGRRFHLKTVLSVGLQVVSWAVFDWHLSK
jgi:hypothetical protein